MKDFEKEISSITDIEYLLSIKEALKTQIIPETVHWEDRMTLYKKIQLINERIKQLQDTMQV
ncbi:hypothetical protein JQN58_19165 [Aneurinibacillus sp. BA2021]|nr:hypothetical protein [Aneurinibacillus sp. BA2021]